MKVAIKLVLVPLVVAVLGGIVMFLWNNVMPGLSSDPHPIDYLHAVGLLILCRILFGGFGGGRGGWGRHQRWEKFQSMSPEEREQFRERMKAHRAKWHGE
jgi:hypothetical protein